MAGISYSYSTKQVQEGSRGCVHLNTASSQLFSSTQLFTLEGSRASLEADEVKKQVCHWANATETSCNFHVALGCTRRITATET